MSVHARNEHGPRSYAIDAAAELSTISDRDPAATCLALDTGQQWYMGTDGQWQEIASETKLTNYVAAVALTTGSQETQVSKYAHVHMAHGQVQAAIADTSGATLAAVEAEVNKLKAVLRDQGSILP